MSKALLRYIRLSPTKARLIAREVQGMNAELAIASLEFMPNKAAKIISRCNYAEHYAPAQSPRQPCRPAAPPESR